jgi:hypothetical protein
MGLQNLLSRLKGGVFDTPDISEISTGYQAKPRTGAACTLDTPDTSPKDCTRETAANDTAAPWRVTVAPGTSPDTLARLRAASLALDRQQASLSTEPPDAWCWPHSTAMNGAEIDTFMARLARFIDEGLVLEEAEALADKLVIRDREADDRRVCLECVHLRHGGRCGNWQQAGIAIKAIGTRFPDDFITILQRCDGFT